MKKYEPLNNNDRKYLNKFTVTEIESCELICGGVPLHDEFFIRNNKTFQELAKDKLKNNDPIRNTQISN